MKREVTSKRETIKALIHKRGKPPMTHPICPPVPLQAVPAGAAKMHLAVGWPLAAHTAPPAVVPAFHRFYHEMVLRDIICERIVRRAEKGA